MFGLYSMQDLSFLKHISFEINDHCQLTKFHKECPRNNDRFKNLSQKYDLSVLLMSAWADFCMSRGFKGNFNLHYYNEPLMSLPIIQRLLNEFPPKSISLWTNGIKLQNMWEKGMHSGKSEEVYEFVRKFQKIMITIYPESKLTPEFLQILHFECKNIETQDGILDLRNSGPLGRVPLDYRKCYRPDFEMIIDYHGNLRLCCGDWAGEFQIGNILEDPFEIVLSNWDDLRKKIDTPNFDALPQTCKDCVSRSPNVSGNSNKFRE